MIPGIVASGVGPQGTPTTGLSLPGTSGNYLSVPDSSDLSITGDFAGMLDLAMVDWTPGSTSALMGKFGPAGQDSWRVTINASSIASLGVSANGTAITTATNTSSPIVAADGSFICWGWTWRASDGRVQYWTAPTGTSTFPSAANGWTQLGSDRTANVGAIFDSTTAVEIGSIVSGTTFPLAGTIRRARVWASIDGTDERLDVNCVGQTKTATRAPSTFTEAAKSATVTVNGSAWDWVTT